MLLDFPIAAVRQQFPGLQRKTNGQTSIFLDGPAGSQVPTRVAEAVSNYMLYSNANDGGYFPTSVESQGHFERAQQDVAAFLGASQPQNIVFGANMTTLTYHFSRSFSKQLRPGDEVIVSDLDHDANVSPWVQAARDAGATVKRIPVNAKDGTLEIDKLAQIITSKSRLIAVGLASNLTGTINPIPEIVAIARDVGALVYVDAVHYGPHDLINVQALGCDALVCSAYKFFGPHVGILWATDSVLNTLQPYKVRPAKNHLPDRWMTGTPNFEGVVGAAEAVRYLASVHSTQTHLREALVESFASIRTYEMALFEPLLLALRSLPKVQIWGIDDPVRFDQRVPTVSFTHRDLSPNVLAKALADRGIFVWSGHHYALRYSELSGLEPGGTLRIGLLHYNTREEVDRTIQVLTDLLG